MGFTKPASSTAANNIDDEKTYSLSDVDEINVNMASESVRIYQTEAGSEIRFHYYGWSIPERRMVTEIVNGRVTVRAQGLFSLGNLKLDVYLPVDYAKKLSVHSASGAITTDSFDLMDLNLDTASGRIATDTIKADSVSITSSSGAVDVKSVEAKDVLIKSQSGSLKVAGCVVDEIELRTASGSIQLDEMSGNVDVSTASGRVEIVYTKFDQNTVAISNTSGPISLTLPADAAFNLDARSTSGRVQSDFQVSTIQAPGKNAAYGQVGEGKGSVTLTSTSGRINLYKAN